MISMLMNIRIPLLLLALVLGPALNAGVSSTTVNWESVDGAGPGRTTVSTIVWRTSLGSLAVRDPLTSEWVGLRHLATKPNGTSLGAMFVGRCDDGRQVQVTLIGKPSSAPKRFEYALTFTKGARDRMFYGNCNDDLEDCFRANR